MSASVDSMVLIYAGVAPQNPATLAANFKELKTKALILLHDIAEKQTPCIVSSIVLSELLIYVASSKRGAFSAEFSAQFVVAPFDFRAASIAADLWTAYKATTGLPKKDRVALRSDCLIVASSYAAGATDFFSHDANCRTFAKLAGMQAHDLPDISQSMMDTWMAADIDAGIDVAAPTKPMKGTKRTSSKRKKPKQ